MQSHHDGVDEKHVMDHTRSRVLLPIPWAPTAVSILRCVPYSVAPNFFIVAIVFSLPTGGFAIFGISLIVMET